MESEEKEVIRRNRVNLINFTRCEDPKFLSFFQQLGIFIIEDVAQIVSKIINMNIYYIFRLGIGSDN